jgi:thymidylate synthase
MMIAQECNLGLGDFVHTLGDAHIYLNHVEQVEKQIKRSLRPLPKMHLNPNVKSVFDFKYEDFELTDYNPHSGLKGKVAV